MGRVVFIGGFSNGAKAAERVAEALSTHYDRVEAWTFPSAMKNQRDVELALARSYAVTHGAGMLALWNARPSETLAVGAPLPTKLGRIAFRTVEKSIQMFTDKEIVRSKSDAARFNVESIAELSSFHSQRGRGHWKYLSSICSFNAIDAGIRLRNEQGSQVSLIYGDKDLYYRPSNSQVDQARQAGVGVELLPDTIHDSLVLYPNETVEKIMALRGAAGSV